MLTTDNTILLVILSCIVVILWFAVQPVERVWSHTDVALTYIIPILTLIGIALNIIKNKRPTLSWLDVVLLTWFLYVMGYAYFDASYPCAAFCLRTMQMMMVYIALRFLMSSVPVKERYVVVLITVFALYEACLGISQLMSGHSRHHLYLLTGSFLNPGPYSATLAIGLVMTLMSKRKEKRPILNLLIAVFAIVLAATWSRAALLATAVCIGIIYWNNWKRCFWWVAAVGIAVSTGLYFIKAGSADGRAIIYLISVLSIMHYPFLGSGVGCFFHQYAEEMAQFSMRYPGFNMQSADVLDYAFNDLLRIGVEQGLVGIGFALLVICLAFQSLRNKGRILRMGFLALLIFSLFSYPFELLPYQLIMVLILTYAGTNNSICIHKELKPQLIHRFFIPTCSLLLMILVAIFVFHQIDRRTKAEADYKMMAGITDNAFIDDYYELLPLITENPRFFFDFGKMLARQGRYNDSNAILKRGALVSNDPMFYVIQGNNYRDMDAYKEAELAYLTAFHVLPNRLYPLYQLMCLYELIGDDGKTKDMAQRIKNFNVKIESPATQEMKTKAQKILNL